MKPVMTPVRQRLTFNNEREVASDLRHRPRVSRHALVLALVAEVHVWNDQLLTEARVVRLARHRRVETTPRHTWCWTASAHGITH